MKVRVLVPTENLDKGEILNIPEPSVNLLLSYKVVEEVKEESLEEKMEKSGLVGSYSLSALAKQHYLEIFDKAVKEYNPSLKVSGWLHHDVRKAIEEG